MIQVTGTLSNVPAISNYENLDDKPQINGVELSGNKTTDDLGLVSKEQLEQLQTEAQKSFEETDSLIKELQQQTEDLQNTIDNLVDGNEVAY